VSLATVYNNLHQFTRAGLVRQISVDGSKAFFDTNPTEHHHFFIAAEHVLLDITDKRPSFVKERFPGIYGECLRWGIDITRQPIPVVPAAHYTCGGVAADLHGRTDVGNLYAVGETAYTGLHGANRLASNSLVECLVFAEAAAQDILSRPQVEPVALPQWDESQVTDADEQIVISHNWEELRRFMWDYVGIVRTSKRLQRAQHRIRLLHEEINEYYANFHVTSDLLELRNLVLSADLIVQSALARHESRGLHYSKDYPATLPQAVPTVLAPPGYGATSPACFTTVPPTSATPATPGMTPHPDCRTK